MSNNPYDARKLFAERMEEGDIHRAYEIIASHVYQGMGIRNGMRKMVENERRVLGEPFNIEKPAAWRALQLMYALAPRTWVDFLTQFEIQTAEESAVVAAERVIASLTSAQHLIVLAASKKKRTSPIVLFPATTMWMTRPYRVDKFHTLGDGHVHIVQQTVKDWVAQFGPFEIDT